MRQIRSVNIAVILIFIWLGGFLTYPLPSAHAEVDTTPSTPTDSAISALTDTESKGVPNFGRMSGRPTAKPGTYMIRTVWKDAPLTKVRVEWRRHVEDAKPALSASTIGVGTANFRPEPGSYYLTADWRPDGDFERPRRPGDRFAWFGGNPLLVSTEASEVFTLILEEVPLPPQSALPKGTGIFGRVTLGGEPAANVGVYAYAKTKTGSGFKGDDYQAVVRTNVHGEFVLELPPNEYYLLARLRADKSVNIGPLHKEDLLGYDPGNPVVVVKDGFAPSAIALTRLKMVKSRAESSAFLPGTIEGRIVDLDGRPVAGAYASLYEKSNMSGRSLFRSEPTGADGRFKFSVPIPGKYFLSARSGYGSPAENSWFGAWDRSVDHSISVKTGKVSSDVVIIVNRLSNKTASLEIP